MIFYLTIFFKIQIIFVFLRFDICRFADQLHFIETHSTVVQAKSHYLASYTFLNKVYFLSFSQKNY